MMPIALSLLKIGHPFESGWSTVSVGGRSLMSEQAAKDIKHEDVSPLEAPSTRQFVSQHRESLTANITKTTFTTH